MSDDASVTTPRSLGQLISSLATWGLPPDLLRDVSRRLGLVALCFAGGCVWGLVAPHLFHRMGWLPEWMAHPGQPVMGAGLALGLLVYAITRHAPLSAAGIISLGLAFEILGGFVLVLSENLNLAANPQLVARPGLSWVAVWITIFPLLVPASVPVTIGAALVTASLSPVAWWVVTQLGYPRIPGATLPIILIPNYVAAALALVSAIVVRRMQRQIIEARAMGSYRLADRLGAGGMGEVWSATHRLLARPAAVKLIRRDVLAKISPEAARVWIERFRREAEAAATLRSPHTIELYDFGEAADGTFYYVMEMLEGIDLQALVERVGPVPPERAIHLLSQACESLAEAHARGLVHRDIKPSNVYACRLGFSVDFVKVLDFGLVKATSADETTDIALTRPMTVIGTPAYMAPEIVGGDEVTPLADVYSIGCVAYWLLTGQLVFEAENPGRAMKRHLLDPPAPPSRRVPLPISPELDAVVLQCLAKDADDRPDALELARRLKACPEAEAWTTQRASAWWQEHLPLSGVVPSAAGAVERPPGALEPGPTNAWPRTNP